MKRRDLVDLIRKVGINNKELQDLIETELVKVYVIDDIEELSSKVWTFISHFKARYNKHNRMYDRLVEKESSWLNEDIYTGLLCDDQQFEESLIELQNEDVNRNIGGRPKKDWASSGERAKRLRVSELKKVHTTDELMCAATSRAKDSPGKRSLWHAVKQSVSDPDKVRKSLEKSEPMMMTPTQALALKVQLDLSDDQYQILRNSAIQQHANIYPTLHALLKAKEECYPVDLSITETSALSSLEAITHHTLSRILELSDENMKEIGSKDCSGTFYLKMGFDGASSQSIYNQRFEETDLNVATIHEESLFQTAIAPLKLVISDKDIWVNKKPSSPHF